MVWQKPTANEIDLAKADASYVFPLEFDRYNNYLELHLSKDKLSFVSYHAVGINYMDAKTEFEMPVNLEQLDWLINGLVRLRNQMYKNAS